MGIAYKTSDKFLDQALRELIAFPVIRKITEKPTHKNIYVYGLKSSRDLDFCISANVAHCSTIVAFLRNKGFSVDRGSYLQAQMPMSFLLGVGFNIRKNNKEMLQKVATMVLASVNDSLNI